MRLHMSLPITASPSRMFDSCPLSAEPKHVLSLSLCHSTLAPGEERKKESKPTPGRRLAAAAPAVAAPPLLPRRPSPSGVQS
eukprot:1147280-Pelagomonas_calceolata.AAC.14